ncbi:MAG TPA: hypothetical protein VKC61_19555 [Pyrinomonadaceae bacterium]|nr:hypothetical protein [Pyrinomonadaceae bacterium]
MKRFVIAIALACALSSTTLAGEIHSTGAPAPGDIPTSGSPAPGDMPISGTPSPGDIPSDGSSILLLMLDLVF